MNDIGKKILKLREENGLSQEKLAMMLGVARQTVSKWELNTAQTKTKNIEIICKVFGVDTGYFFDIPNAQCAVAVAEKEEEPENEQPEKQKELSTFKILMIVIGVVLLVLFIIACGLACYLTIAPSEGDFVHIVNYEGIIFLVFGILAVAVLITLTVIFIKKRIKVGKKSKLPTLSDKLPTEGGRQDE